MDKQARPRKSPQEREAIAAARRSRARASLKARRLPIRNHRKRIEGGLTLGERVALGVSLQGGIAPMGSGPLRVGVQVGGDASGQGYPEEIWQMCLMEIAVGKAVRAVFTGQARPTNQALYTRIQRDPEFAEAYRQAQAAGAHAMADELVEIADDSGLDVSVSDDGKVQVDGQTVRRAELRIKTRQWLISKRLPHLYGDRTTVDVDPANPLGQLFASLAGTTLRPREIDAGPVVAEAAEKDEGNR